MTKHITHTAHVTFEQYQLMTYHQRVVCNRLRKALGMKPHHGSRGKPSPLKGQPSPLKGIPRPHLRGIPKPTLRRKRPEVWISGPDPIRHEKYDPYLKSKAQANYREEGWDMTFDEFVDLWGDLWSNRGKDADNHCMTRKDWKQPWSYANCEVVTRLEQLQRQGKARRGTMRRAR